MRIVGRWLNVLAALAGVVLLAWYVRRIGLERIQTGLGLVGIGFAGILALSFLRFVARAMAWTRFIDAPVPFRRALMATVGGDALGTLTPLGMFASEPAKALYLDRDIKASRGLPALAAENFFYSVSALLYMVVGASAMLQTFPVPPVVQRVGVWSIVALTIVLAGAGWLAWRQPAFASGLMSRLTSREARFADRLRRFEDRLYQSVPTPRHRLWVVALCHLSFHALSVGETWLTIWLLTGTSLPMHALVFDAFNRISNIAFRIVPLRLGVDQAGSGFVAQAIGLDPAVGVTLSLVRTGRIVTWAAIGVVILGLRSRSRPPDETVLSR